MALTATAFGTLVGGAQQLHAYKSADAIATIVASGYFTALTNRLHQFDIILVVSETGGTAAADLLIVTSATAAATVTTAALA